MSIFTANGRHECVAMLIMKIDSAHVCVVLRKCLREENFVFIFFMPSFNLNFRLVSVSECLISMSPLASHVSGCLISVSPLASHDSGCLISMSPLGSHASVKMFELKTLSFLTKSYTIVKMSYSITNHPPIN